MQVEVSQCQMPCLPNALFAKCPVCPMSMSTSYGRWKGYNSHVSIALTHQRHFMVGINTCEKIDTAVHIGRVLNVR
ncbi:MAG: hypothetical protein JGK37_22660 [Microcoleus sp. PH2017_06_SFM_O_A]|nr:hypothetical protein [Microcoleus sp. PH2017_06_SFM_O_A]